MRAKLYDADMLCERFVCSYRSSGGRHHEGSSQRARRFTFHLQTVVPLTDSLRFRVYTPLNRTRDCGRRPVTQPSSYQGKPSTWQEGNPPALLDGILDDLERSMEVDVEAEVAAFHTFADGIPGLSGNPSQDIATVADAVWKRIRSSFSKDSLHQQHIHAYLAYRKAIALPTDPAL